MRFVTSDVDDNTAFALPTAVLYVKGGASAGGTCDVVIRGGVASQYNNGKARLWLASDASHSSYIESIHTGYGNTQLTFGTANGNALPTERMRIASDGTLSIAYDRWHTSMEGLQRVYYAVNGTTHLRGHGGTSFTFRNGADSDMMFIYGSGNVVIPGNLNVGSLTNPSDSRIKKDIKDINDATALNKLLLIQPTTYNYIDEERNKGFGKVYGFIAQQIREVIPEAVPIIEYIIPNIYKSCLINNKREVYHSIPLDTPIDTDVKIRGSAYKIKEIHEDYFVIDKDIDTDDAFVFGYSVDDFHTLNKDYIFTLNVCATQELHRRIEAQSVLLKSQDDRIKDLETKVATLLNSNAT